MGDVTSSQHTKGCNILFGVALALLATGVKESADRVRFTGTRRAEQKDFRTGNGGVIRAHNRGLGNGGGGCIHGESSKKEVRA